MKKILVIEDNFEVRDNLMEILELSGYDVTAAENGKIGVKEALSNPPDIILCDVMMPELDGFGVLRILDSKPTTSDIPFIFLTAKAEKTDFRKGMNLGADDYITKPFDDVELLNAIEMRLKKSERIRTAFDGTDEGLQTFINEAKGEEQLENLPKNRETRLFAKKDIIYEENGHPRYLYFIKKGKVKVYKTNEWGKELIITVLKEGNFLGYEALIQTESYKESAAALEATELSLIPHEEFTSMLYGSRELSAKFIKMLASDIAQKEEQLIHLAYDSIRKRVAIALMQLYDRYESKGISIMRDDLAALVGTAKETAIRTLTDFRKENLITVKGSKITVLAPDKLREIQG